MTKEQINSLDIDNLQNEIKKCKTMEDITGKNVLTKRFSSIRYL